MTGEGDASIGRRSRMFRTCTYQPMRSPSAYAVLRSTDVAPDSPINDTGGHFTGRATPRRPLGRRRRRLPGRCGGGSRLGAGHALTVATVVRLASCDFSGDTKMRKQLSSAAETLCRHLPRYEQVFQRPCGNAMRGQSQKPLMERETAEGECSKTVEPFPHSWFCLGALSWSSRRVCGRSRESFQATSSARRIHPRYCPRPGLMPPAFSR